MSAKAIIIYEDLEPSVGSYDKDRHLSSMCDKCGKDVGYHNLTELPFIFHDYNDHVHPDVLPPRMYHQYAVCEDCK